MLLKCITIKMFFFMKIYISNEKIIEIFKYFGVWISALISTFLKERIETQSCFFRRQEQTVCGIYDWRLYYSLSHKSFQWKIFSFIHKNLFSKRRCISCNSYVTFVIRFHQLMSNWNKWRKSSQKYLSFQICFNKFKKIFINSLNN